MTIYTTLKHLAAAKRELTRLGFEIKKCNHSLNSRDAYEVSDGDRCMMVTDYQLLEIANHGYFAD